mgnify:CR=1 FL=1
MKRFLTRFLLPGLITAAAVAGAVVMVRSAESRAASDSPSVPCSTANLRAPSASACLAMAAASSAVSRGSG